VYLGTPVNNYQHFEELPEKKNRREAAVHKITWMIHIPVKMTLQQIRCEKFF